jgi:hypothetical protein
VRIDRKTLALIVPVDREDGKELYVHVQPLSEEVYDQNWRILALAYQELYAEGLGLSAPRVAANVLRSVAEHRKMWPAVKDGLIAEMHRGASVLAPNAHGAYETFMWDDAVSREIISPADAREVDNVIVFFTVSCCLNRKADVQKDIFDALIGSLGARLTFSTPTEFANSLKTPTAPGHTPAKKDQEGVPHRSSIPV